MPPQPSPSVWAHSWACACGDMKDTPLHFRPGRPQDVATRLPHVGGGPPQVPVQVPPFSCGRWSDGGSSNR